MMMGGQRRWMEGGPMWGGPFSGGRPKVARGDVRLAILHLLAEGPMHGYRIMQELTERSHGIWRPSPGAIYPTLQQLEDEDLVRAEDHEGKRVCTLTPAGRRVVEAAEEGPPWERFGAKTEDALYSLRDTALQVGAAVMQVGRTGDEDQIAKTRRILEEARGKIYRLLAGEES